MTYAKQQRVGARHPVRADLLVNECVTRLISGLKARNIKARAKGPGPLPRYPQAL